MHYTAFYDAHGCLRAKNTKTGEIVDLLAELNRVAAVLDEDEEDLKDIESARQDPDSIPWSEVQKSLGLTDIGNGGPA